MKTCGQLRNVATAAGKKGNGERHYRLAPVMRGMVRGSAAPALALAGLATMFVAAPAYASVPAALTRATAPAACHRQAAASDERVWPLRALAGRPGLVRQGSSHAGTAGRPGHMPWMYVQRAVPLASGRRSGMPWMYAERAVPLGSGRRSGMPWMYAERAVPLASGRRSGMPWMYAERAVPLPVSSRRGCTSTVTRS